MAIAFTMVLTPVSGSSSYLISSYGASGQQAAEGQDAEQNGSEVTYTTDKEGKFTFDLSAVPDDGDADPEHISKAVIKEGDAYGNGSKGTVSFEPITYDLDDMKNDDGSYAKKKVFRYVIEERIPDSADEKGYDSDSDIQYDTGKKYVTVTLTLSGSELKASVKYDGGKVPEFTNTKKPKNPPPTPSVKTGDHSGILLYVTLMLAAIGALAAVLGFRRKKNMQ